MRGISRWNHTPYALLNAPQITRAFYIPRLAPYKGGFVFEFHDTDTGGHDVLVRRRGKQREWTRIPGAIDTLSVTGLRDGVDYEVRLTRHSDGLSCAARLVRPGEAVGRVVNYLHPDDTVYAFSGRYLCSPSLLALPSGKLLASMDVYAQAHAQNLTLLFESTDGGLHWRSVTELYPCFWGKLFYHRGATYMLGVSNEYGDLLLGRSDDEGQTWGPPVRLFPGSNAQEIGLHKAPMPIIEHDGCLYTAVDYGAWKHGGHQSALLTCEADADLLRPENWRLTFPLPCRADWPGMPLGETRGCLEGNAIAAPNGAVYNILRLQQNACQPSGGNAVILRFVSPDAPLAFERVISFPLGANSKFVILRDKDLYIAVGNEWYDPQKPNARNVLAVAMSTDLVRWRITHRVIDRREVNPREVAFQYPDAQIAGDDLLILSRTAMNGANSFHNGNLITFHRVANYRTLL